MMAITNLSIPIASWVSLKLRGFAFGLWAPDFGRPR